MTRVCQPSSQRQALSPLLTLGSPNVGRKLSDDISDSGSAPVAVSGTHIHVAWDLQVWPGPTYSIYYRNSTDNGFSWNPVQLLTGPSPMINDPDIDVCDDKVSIVWGDDRDDGVTAEVYYKESLNGGITWSSDIRLSYNESFDSHLSKVTVINSSTHIVNRNFL